VSEEEQEEEEEEQVEIGTDESPNNLTSDNILPTRNGALTTKLVSNFIVRTLNTQKWID
jgi:hypothetical protein